MLSPDLKKVWDRGIIEVAQFRDLLAHEEVKIIDGTWAVSIPSNGFAKGVIPEAQFFDLGQLKSVSDFKAAYPSREGLIKMLEGLNISADDPLIIYDRQGFFSAPRVWWSLKSLGHKKVAVLKNGLPAWLENGGPVRNNYTIMDKTSEYVASKSLAKGVVINEVLAAINGETQIVDARSADRFYGRTAEPRAGLRSGHIPSSLSLPLSSLKDSEGRILKGDDLLTAFHDAGVDLKRPIITTCGSGVTASALALLFRSVGKTDVSVYSGSWTEYGASEYPIETE